MSVKFKKAKRLNLPGNAHELTFSCYQNRPFLKSKWICKILAEAINTAKIRHIFHVLAYVFMPDHVHILILPENEKYDISKILHSIKQSVSRRVLIHARKSNPALLESMKTKQKNKPYRFWQAGGGYDRNIISAEALISSAKYIHNNPARKGLVKSATDWIWSSAQDWNGTGKGLIEISKEKFV